LIVLQSDEGPWPSEYAGDEISCFGMDVTSPDWTAVDPEDLREKMAVLNAIYLPGKFSITISDDFSPVNTFRLILREYFGQKLPDLPTQTQVYLNGSAIWQFLDVQDDLAGAEPR